MNGYCTKCFLGFCEAIDRGFSFDVFNCEAVIFKVLSEMTSARDEKEEPLRMPFSSGAHAFALDENDGIFFGIGISKDSKIAMEMVEGNVENPLHLARIATYFGNSQITPMRKAVL